MTDEDFDRDRFNGARSAAIDEYAKVEASLSFLFAKLLGTKESKAAAVFYRITSAHARNSIIQSLLSENFGERFNQFWRGTEGLLTYIRQLDSRRNEIVHWHVNIAPGAKVSIYLAPPNFWTRNTDTPIITIEHLEEFHAHATFVNSAINTFSHYTIGPQVPEFLSQQPAWLQVFEQPLPYPPPKNHPLFPKKRAG